MRDCAAYLQEVTINDRYTRPSDCEAHHEVRREVSSESGRFQTCGGPRDPSPPLDRRGGGGLVQAQARISRARLAPREVYEMMKTCEICASEFYTQRGVNQVTCSYDCNARRRRAVFLGKAIDDPQGRRAPNARLLSKGAVQTEASSR